MNKSSSSLTKICSNCGLQKPLSAFLELTGPHGASYGNVCANCRKTVIEQANKTESEESTTSTTKVRIDSKTKVQSDFDKKEFLETQKENYDEERKENETQQIKLNQKSEITAKDAEKHKQSQLAKRFLDRRNVSPETPSHEQTARAQDQTVDLTKSFTDTGITGKVKYNNPLWKGHQAKHKDTPFGKQGETEATIVKQVKSWLDKSPPQSKQDAKQTSEEKSKTAIDYINKTLRRPGGGGQG